jgi:hypothetical protein
MSSSQPPSTVQYLDVSTRNCQQGESITEVQALLKYNQKKVIEMVLQEV